MVTNLLWEAIVGKGEIQFWLGGKVGDTFNIHHLKTIIYKINAILEFNFFDFIQLLDTPVIFL